MLISRAQVEVTEDVGKFVPAAFWRQALDGDFTLGFQETPIKRRDVDLPQPRGRGCREIRLFNLKLKPS